MTSVADQITDYYITSPMYGILEYLGALDTFLDTVWLPVMMTMEDMYGV